METEELKPSEQGEASLEEKGEESGAPQAVEAPEAESASSDLLEFAGRALLVAGATVVGLWIVSGAVLPCHGATRSVRLQWEERQTQIENVVSNERGPSCEER